MAARNDDSLLFVVEWFDPLPMMKKQYLLKFFVDQHMVEMVDLKSRKMFLRKSACPNELTRADFFVGSKILLYSRELEIVDYGDLKTKEQLHQQIQQVVAILPPDAYNNWGKAIQKLNGDLAIIKLKTVLLAPNLADRVCNVLNLSQRTSGALSNGVSLVAVFQGEDAYNKAEQAAASLGSMYCSTNGVQANELQSLIVDASMPSTATFDSCTCVIVKPHAIKAKQFGDILAHIVGQGYEVSAAQAMTFDRNQAEEFLKVYKGVIPDFADHVAQLAMGLCVALEVRAENAVRTFRETAGPWDVEMAKELRPDTIRGRYGVDRPRSAVHCTDLPQDGTPECEYCFRVMV